MSEEFNWGKFHAEMRAKKSAMLADVKRHGLRLLLTLGNRSRVARSAAAQILLVVPENRVARFNDAVGFPAPPIPADRVAYGRASSADKRLYV